MLLITTRGGYGKLLANLTTKVTVDNYTKFIIEGKTTVLVDSDELTRLTGKPFKRMSFSWTIGQGAEFI
jgi:hypothetical protein